MNDEKARAKYYQAHKDDPDEWGKPERSPASAKRRLASMISVRFSPDEATTIRRAAEAVDESVSQFVRKATLQRCQHQRATVASVTGTTQDIPPIQLHGFVGRTLTNGGPSSRAGSNWKPRIDLAESSTA